MYKLELSKQQFKTLQTAVTERADNLKFETDKIKNMQDLLYRAEYN